MLPGAKGLTPHALLIGGKKPHAPSAHKTAYYREHYNFFPMKKQVKNRRDL